MLQRKLRKRGMPQNLIYLAFEEWALDPEGTVGTTRRRYLAAHAGHGQTVRFESLKKRDERLKVEKETDAALRFLDHLYDYFGSWYLAAAAYNAGQHRIARIMKKKLGRHTGRDRDYYRIWGDLPPQTRDYVPAIIALERIGKNPKKYGF